MASLIDHISEEIKSAMKAKEKVRLETLRSIKKVLLEKEVSVRPSGQQVLTEEQEMEALMQLAKQRRDAIEQYQSVGRQDLADQEAQELVIIEGFLPQQLTEDEVVQAIDAIIAQVGATSPKDMGKVMGPAMQQLKGKTDGKKVQAIVKAKLGG
ncbi:MAG: glutamyl-tRNA amidotransferase [Alkalinema sp. CACIAM 70d]|nr:MAG: glutamyl-tRNA amidotransferase [Alkalinema sp. CACIAM 70d]